MEEKTIFRLHDENDVKQPDSLEEKTIPEVVEEIVENTQLYSELQEKGKKSMSTWHLKRFRSHTLRTGCSQEYPEEKDKNSGSKSLFKKSSDFTFR